MEPEKNQDRLLFKLIYIIRRLIDHRSALHLPGLTNINVNVSHLPYFMSIGYSGISNHALLKEIKVTRQGVSKTIKELEKLQLVYTLKNENDARSKMIYLTDEGTELYKSIKEIGESTTMEYITFLGSKKYNLMIDSLIEIIKHHESEDAATIE